MTDPPDHADHHARYWCVYCLAATIVLPLNFAHKSRKSSFAASILLEYICGVPQSIKCDNLRSAVSKSNRYEPQFNEAKEYEATHYGNTVLAARVRKPRDKGSVEKASSPESYDQ
ncbi:MAG TPA: hypothetical protein VE978_05120 [Chitinophagales bacterium]|nr:hypothetical protein [Chitinophagales bacterium]